MVSVIIPVYNGEDDIANCLKSVLSQSYNDFEVIIIDDGSTDRTAEICREIAAGDERITLICQKNAGVSASRNKGIELARGEYITFVDADDMLTSGALEALMLGVGDSDLIIGSHTEFRGSRTYDNVWQPEEYTYESAKANIRAFNKKILSPWAKLYRRSLMIENGLFFTSGIAYGEDHIYNFKYCLHAKKIKVISNVVYMYRRGGMATSIKYYPNSAEFEKAIFEARCIFFGGIESTPPDFYNEALCTGIIGSVTHYIVHCNKKEVISKIAATLSLFEIYIKRNEITSEALSTRTLNCINALDALGLYKSVKKEQYVAILKRKFKKLYFKLFRKRI